MVRQLTSCLALPVILGLLFTTLYRQGQSPVEPQPPSAGGSYEAVSLSSSEGGRSKAFPSILSTRDSNLYRAIFAAQKKGDWAAADASISKLSDRMLLGHVLAERYLHRRYSSTPEALAAWLREFPDHPQAYDIYELALQKAPALRGDLPTIRKQSTIQGYGDEGMTSMRFEAAQALTWQKAISAWRAGEKAEAARLFSILADNRAGLTAWQASASSFWAARAHAASGNKALADKYMQAAAENPRSFYGILASRKINRPLQLDRQPLSLSESDWLEMVGEPAIRRIIALGQIGNHELAEQELRTEFPRAEAKEKWQLLALAHQLQLASVQISMARQLGNETRSLDLARYPVPYWKPQDGFRVEPALIYAMARQESGFRAEAVSPYGAMGVMQLMPKTASMMQKDLGSDITGNVSEPSLNMMLGQNYIQHLLENALVEGNIVYMLAAYNAGPGRLQEWKNTIAQDDPLLFIESIPFAETRAYVMQVMTNYWVYSALSGTMDRSSLALASSAWPHYGRPVASRATTGQDG